MIRRRTVLAGLTGLAAPAVTGCAGRQPASYQQPGAAQPIVGYATSAPAFRPTGLDAVIDISHMVTVDDFVSVRHSNILAVVHKSTEGGDWTDPSYAVRRQQAEAAGLLWGAYHFGTRQYSGSDQAMAFLAATQPGPATLMALDLEPNDANPRNTMTLDQAEAFVLTVHQATGRMPLLYTHPGWANGEPYGRRGLRLSEPITPASLLARCDLWLADYRETPEMPYAWANRGWRLWQYAANETDAHRAYGDDSRDVAGVSHCDRNLFAGDEAALYRYWKKGPTGTV